MLYVCLYRFIEKYGTHIVVGVTMGGKDVIHMKQLRNSNHEPDEVQKLLKQLADKRFSADPVESISPANAYSGKPEVKSLEKFSVYLFVLIAIKSQWKLKFLMVLQEENPLHWGFNGSLLGTSVKPAVVISSKNEVRFFSPLMQ